MRPARSRKLWAWIAGGLVVGIFVAAVYVYGFWAYLTHEHDDFFDRDLARKVNIECAGTAAEVAEIPPLPPSPTPSERAQRVEAGSDAFARMTKRFRPLSPARESETFDRWVEVWREFIVLGRRFAAAIRTGDPSVYEPAGNLADDPALELAQIARANGMEECLRLVSPSA